LNKIKERYARNFNALSVEDVLKLHGSRVCIVGGGGLGGYVTEMLARVGVLNVTLVDGDVFTESNLNRQLFSDEQCIGRYKTDVAAERIAKVNSSVRFNGVREMLTEANAKEIIQGNDVVVDALDNLYTRKLLAKACAKLDIPMVHGSVAGWCGQVICIYPGDDTLNIIYENAAEDRGMEVELGNLPFTVAAVAAVQCAECVKVLTGKKDGKIMLTQIDLLSGERRRVFV